MICAIWIVASLSSASSGQTIYPSADGTLVDGGVFGVFDGIPDDADWSFGGDGYQGAITLDTRDGLQYRVMWEYDLSGVTLGPNVSARLSFTLRGAPVFPFPDSVVHVYAYAADLQETLGDFSAGPATYQGSVTVIAYQNATEYTLNVTVAVKQALLTGANRVAFRFEIDPSSPHEINQAFFDARDGSPSTKPFITIDPACPADFDGDGDVDLSDFGHLQTCFVGPATPPGDALCQDADLDGDNDVDQDDLVLWEGCMSGPEIMADLNCANQ